MYLRKPSIDLAAYVLGSTLYSTLSGAGISFCITQDPTYPWHVHKNKYMEIALQLRNVKCHGGLPYESNITKITLLCIARTGLLRVSVKWRFLGSLGFDDGVWMAKHLKLSWRCTV